MIHGSEPLAEQPSTKDALRYLLDRLIATRIVAAVEVSGPNDPRCDYGVLEYACSLSNGQMRKLKAALNSE